MQKPERLKERLLRAELCSPDELKGCSQKQLREIEKCARAPLPADYLEALSLIGCHAGDFMGDLDFFYPAMLALTDRTRELLAESISLPEDSFVFADRYGEQILFFRLSEKQKGAIFKWSAEEPEQFSKVFNSFGEFLEEELTAHEMQAGD
ncbi:SMI1 / KNR4 family protein [Gimesia panareensis]|uniref:SMI1 / KNR4 family protein n=1 Tax=Gimesia panareensis TaxID=2527978 RepID=A0A518FPW9_9PLAN|nr:SMI1/KNR4 family protein [Gimesia panareensis]QDV18388.1 SMI1 / KNR4 family protein [Gimesia panareensis]